ncbi:urease accessory protein UreF [Thiocystis violacea]|uniref:urease accessory protein UreF n=1 Tax=Thiocystis violacea TaxID=13725 RepID=UPI001907495E|nr:urease accessory protein UreF [Thiocystis violacea]MBK1719874.1 urease accessory protein UreF [Thiocystis violacea]
MTTDPALLRLLHLASPSLPTGAFAYSQGIEWAVERGWLRTAADLEAWLCDQLRTTQSSLDLPILARMHGAARQGDEAALADWTVRLLASRETQELRAEESNRGRALADLLVSLEVPGAAGRKPLLARAQATGFAYAAAHWGIEPAPTLIGYAWGWLENLVLAAIKIIPLGQTQGHQTLSRLIEVVPEAVERALALEDDAIGASSPALAIASSRHETQYTRLFRS